MTEQSFEEIKTNDLIEIWKTVINVQMHFNDISMRIRSMFVTILLALLASIGFVLDKDLTVNLGSASLEFATVLPIFGILGTYLFYFIDRYWYHRLLTGSVKHGLKIEAKYSSRLSELGLTNTIGAESPYKPRNLTKILAWILVKDERWNSKRELHAEAKVQFFYKSVMLALFILFLLLLSSGFASGPIEKYMPNAHTTAASPVIQAPEGEAAIKIDQTKAPSPETLAQEPQVERDGLHGS